MTGSEGVKRGRGRPSKGVRADVRLRVPVPLKQAAREAADAQGLSENDFYLALAARYLGMKGLAPRLEPANKTTRPRKDNGQEELQLQDIA